MRPWRGSSHFGARSRWWRSQAFAGCLPGEPCRQKNMRGTSGGSARGRSCSRILIFIKLRTFDRRGESRVRKMPFGFVVCALLYALPTPIGTAAAQAITVGATSSTSDAPIYIADKKGYFRDEGFDVKVTNFRSAADMVAPLGAGQIEAGAGSASAGLYNAVARGIKIKIVADKASSPPGYGGTKILVRKNHVESGRYRSLQDLKGMKFAMNAPGVSNTSTLNTLLQSAGLKYSDVETVDLPLPDHVAALKNKSVDASASVEPGPALAIRNGDAVPIKSDDEILPNHQIAVLLYSEEFAFKRADAARRFMRAYIRAVRFYNGALQNGRLDGPNADDVIAILSEATPIKGRDIYKLITPLGIDARAHRHVQRQRAEDRDFRRQLLVRPLRHQGAGAMVGELAGLPPPRPHGGRGGYRFHAADRPLEGLRRRHRLSRQHARDHHLGRRPSLGDRAHDRVRHGARASVPPADRGQGIRHRRPRRRRTLWRQPRGGMERGRVRDVRGDPARARRALRFRSGMARRRQASLVGTRRFRFPRTVPRPQGRARLPQALRRHAADHHECRLLGGRPGLCATQLRCILRGDRGLANVARGQCEEGRRDQGGGAKLWPRHRDLHGRAGDLSAEPDGGGGLLPPRHHRERRLGCDRRHAREQEHHAADDSARGVRQETPVLCSQRDRRLPLRRNA